MKSSLYLSSIHLSSTDMKIRNILFGLSLLPSFLTANAQSISYDTKLGTEGAKKIESQIGVCDCPQATLLLDSIGNRLVKRLGNQPFTYEFKVLNQVEPNAMTLPGGHIYFSRGIVALANSEDELACVMGHEIIHAYKRHAVKAAKKGVIPTVIKLPGNLVKIVSPSLGKLINTPVEGASELLMANYSRQNENEADFLGVKLAAHSGYDPRALGSILSRIDKTMELLSGEKSRFSYFDSHPWTGTRVKNIEYEANSLKIAETPHLTDSREKFLATIDGMMVSEDPAQGVLRDSLFLHPDMGFSILLPPGWKYHNTPTAIVATEKESEAQMMLGVAGPASSPSDYAKQFLEAANKQGKLNIVRNEEVFINGNMAYIVIMSESTRRGEVYSYMLWLNLKSVTYQFVGVSLKKHEEVMKQSVLSFRRISEEERMSIHKLVVRIVTGVDGESLDELAGRTGSIGAGKFLSVFNNLPGDTRLKDGQVIKVIKREVY